MVSDALPLAPEFKAGLVFVVPLCCRSVSTRGISIGNGKTYKGSQRAADLNRTFCRVQEILNGRFTTKQVVSRQALPQKSAKGVTEPLAVASWIKTQFNLTELAQYL